mgnify:CR=1 FL=1
MKKIILLMSIFAIVKKSNKNDFYNNKKLFEENLKKINMFD